jgi:hypothetical protein
MNQTNNSMRRNNQFGTPPTSSRLNTSSAGSNSSSGYSSSRVIGIVIVVVVLILLVGACYWLYTIYSNRVFQTTLETEVMADVKDAATNFSVGSGSIPSSTYSNEYSVSMWLNIDNYTYNYGKEKTILRRGDKNDSNLEIVLDAKTNDLIVRLKLQNTTVKNPLIISSGASSSVAKFADIPKQEPQTHQNNSNESAEYYNIHGAFTGTGDQTATNSLNRACSNLVDYATIQYQQPSGCNPGMKECFDIAKINNTLIADNSAPLETRNVYGNEYFTAISGNEVSSLKEGFDTTSDLVNACVAVMLDLCKLASAMQSQTNADNQVTAMNTAFQTVIDALEKTRGNAKTPDDLTKIFQSSMENISAMMIPHDTFIPLINNLETDLATLESVSKQTNAQTIGFSTIQSAVNSKLSSMNCPLTLSGTNEIDITTNFYESFINMLKKSLYSYLNNMRAGIQQAFPELAGAQNATCLIQNATNPDPTIGTCIYHAIPLQKWVHVVVSVYNQVIDIFIDGQLASSCVLKAFPAVSTSSVVITPDGGFAGKISRVIFSNTAMTVPHAKKLYYNGPVVSSGLWSMIPNWVWYGIIFIIILVIGYSFLM